MARVQRREAMPSDNTVRPLSFARYRIGLSDTLFSAFTAHTPQPTPPPRGSTFAEGAVSGCLSTEDDGRQLKTIEDEEEGARLGAAGRKRPWG
ncbi:hypothetical protein C8Q78DRAFT_740620 [Trametes maxima]|nr:hypothetical protein C8Q78DRAFT_740620 [Trametes maxima]